MIRKQTTVPRNARAWAIGQKQKRSGGFVIRRVVWGRFLARQERREGEEVRSAFIYVSGKTE